MSLLKIVDRYVTATWLVEGLSNAFAVSIETSMGLRLDNAQSSYRKRCLSSTLTRRSFLTSHLGTL